MELLHAAATSICCIIPQLFPAVVGITPSSGEQGSSLTSPGPLLSYLSSHGGKRLLDFYSVSVSQWGGRQWEVSWGKLPLGVEKERGVQALV